MKKVVVAMSGGVDSSVCAALLKNQGYDVIGVNLWLWKKDCDAKKVCTSLDIPFVCLDRRKEFRENVINYFINSYFDGDTPNPCIACNKHIKFKLLFDYADEIGADFIATGHYARVEKQGEKFVLKKAAYPEKDQSYVLYNLTQSDLARLLLPLGDYTKDEIRQIAKDANLSVERKKDSQDICFIPDGDYAKFISENCDRVSPQGNFVDTSGKVLGKHSGLINYTLGQRRGLGVSSSGRLYVLSKNSENNTVVLGDESGLYTGEFEIKNANFLSDISPTEPLKTKVRTRYSAKEADCVLTPSGDKIKVTLSSPQRAVTNGQSAVFYDGDIVLGGGIIV